MKRIVLIMLAIALNSCEDEDVEIHSLDDDPLITTINGTWKVRSYEDYSLGVVVRQGSTNAEGSDIIITFDDSQAPPTCSGQ